MFALWHLFQQQKFNGSYTHLHPIRTNFKTVPVLFILSAELQNLLYKSTFSLLDIKICLVFFKITEMAFLMNLFIAIPNSLFSAKQRTCILNLKKKNNIWDSATSVCNSATRIDCFYVHLYPFLDSWKDRKLMKLEMLRKQVNSFLVQLNMYFDFFFCHCKAKRKNKHISGSFTLSQ